MMRPAITAACRAALRDAENAQQHVASCSFCTARQKASASIAEFARKRPEMPEALRSEDLLESIYDRVSESAQQTTVAEWLEQASVPAPDADWDGALDVDQSKQEVLGEFLRAPEQPDASVWSDVRRSILADVASGGSDTAASDTAESDRAAARVTNLNLTNWRVLLAGAAAAAVIGLITVSSSDHPNVTNPNVVFADLGRAPDVGFARVRYGPRETD